MKRPGIGILAAVAVAGLTLAPGTAAVSAGPATGGLFHLVGHGQHNIQQANNWSGYAETSSTPYAYTSVTAEWAVPKVSPTSGNTYSSTWVGIDGDGNSNLIQTGTESDYIGGAVHYDAWWEILPAAETVIPSLPVSPGDRMTASIHKSTATAWVITITDTTTGGSFTTTQTYAGLGESAEWIQERPEIGFHLATLAKYGTAVFALQNTLNGKNPDFTAADEIEMVNSSGQVLSIPSAPNAETNGFRVAYGSTAPAPIP